MLSVPIGNVFDLIPYLQLNFKFLWRFTPEIIKWFIEDQAFRRRMIWFLPHSLPSVSSTGVTQEDWGKRGRGNQIIRRRERLVLYKSFNTICFTQRKCSPPSIVENNAKAILHRKIHCSKCKLADGNYKYCTKMYIDIEGTLRRMFVTKTIDEVFKSLTNTKSFPEKTFIKNSFLVQFRENFQGLSKSISSFHFFSFLLSFVFSL